MENTKIHSFRFQPGQDLKKSLLEWAKVHQIKAATLISCVGSLREIRLRLATGQQAVEFKGPQEIVSLVGTFSQSGGHFHLALADHQGQVVGGHLMEGNLVYTTAEVVILEMTDREFVREADPQTGYLELRIK